MQSCNFQAARLQVGEHQAAKLQVASYKAKSWKVASFKVVNYKVASCKDASWKAANCMLLCTLWNINYSTKNVVENFKPFMPHSGKST